MAGFGLTQSVIQRMNVKDEIASQERMRNAYVESQERIASEKLSHLKYVSDQANTFREKELAAKTNAMIEDQKVRRALAESQIGIDSASTDQIIATTEGLRSATKSRENKEQTNIVNGYRQNLDEQLTNLAGPQNLTPSADIRFQRFAVGTGDYTKEDFEGKTPAERWTMYKGAASRDTRGSVTTFVESIKPNHSSNRVTDRAVQSNRVTGLAKEYSTNYSGTNPDGSMSTRSDTGAVIPIVDQEREVFQSTIKSFKDAAALAGMEPDKYVESNPAAMQLFIDMLSSIPSLEAKLTERQGVNNHGANYNLAVTEEGNAVVGLNSHQPRRIDPATGAVLRQDEDAEGARTTLRAPMTAGGTNMEDPDAVVLQPPIKELLGMLNGDPTIDSVLAGFDAMENAVSKTFGQNAPARLSPEEQQRRINQASAAYSLNGDVQEALTLAEGQPYSNATRVDQNAIIAKNDTLTGDALALSKVMDTNSEDRQGKQKAAYEREILTNTNEFNLRNPELARSAAGGIFDWTTGGDAWRTQVGFPEIVSVMQELGIDPAAIENIDELSDVAQQRLYQATIVADQRSTFRNYAGTISEALDFKDNNGNYIQDPKRWTRAQQREASQLLYADRLDPRSGTGDFGTITLKRAKMALQRIDETGTATQDIKDGPSRSGNPRNRQLQ